MFFRSLLCLIFSAGSFASWTQTVSTKMFIEEQGIVSLRPADIFCQPDKLITMWGNTPVPLTYYTKNEIALQQTINERVSDAIIAYSPAENKDYGKSSIDDEDITPYTWKWIHFELQDFDKMSLTRFSLRRPHWWIMAIGADSIGKEVYIHMPEMGVEGLAKVTAIQINQLDTRVWNDHRKNGYVSRPITGKFVHESDDVYELYFEDNTKPLGVTGSHMIWSADRKQWVAAAKLLIGEKVKKYTGYSKLLKIQKKLGVHTVYNLEVYKDHNYLASRDAILVHNSCWDVDFAHIKNMLNIMGGHESTVFGTAYKSWSKIVERTQLVLVRSIYASETTEMISQDAIGEVVYDAMVTANKTPGVEKIVIRIEPGNFDMKAMRKKMFKQETINGLKITQVDETRGLELSGNVDLEGFKLKPLK